MNKKSSRHQLNRVIHISFWVLISFGLSFEVLADRVPTIDEILALPEEEIDLGLAKIVIDNQLYPDIDVSNNLAKLDRVLSIIKRLPEYGDSQLERMCSILRYMYTPGPWNDNRPYKFNFSDPLEETRSRTIDYVLETQQGICSSLAMFVVILGQRLDIDIFLSVAPLHVFARYHDENDGIINIETTSGRILPDKRYIKAFDILPEAIDNGIYLRDLTRKESIAVMLYQLGRKYLHEKNLTKRTASPI